MTDFDDKLDALKRRVAAAAASGGRDAAEITILAVTKSQPRTAVESAWHAGLRDFGGNYLQETLDQVSAAPRATWHFIGRIQSNKTRRIAEAFAWVHTLDRLDIAERLARQRPDESPDLNVCIQVNIDEEEAKGGVHPAHVGTLAQAISRLPRLRLRGLMAIPRPDPDPVVQRASFARVRGLQGDLCAHGLELDTLSMGMSADLETAIAGGATIIRIGTALFGPRE